VSARVGTSDNSSRLIVLLGCATAFDLVRMDADAEEIEYGRFDDLRRRFGIRRSKAYQMIQEGQIKSACVKKKGARSGVRLIDFESVRQFLRASME
jgi:hypothetical protein